jgi:hypothetical protein
MSASCYRDCYRRLNAYDTCCTDPYGREPWFDANGADCPSHPSHETVPFLSLWWIMIRELLIRIVSAERIWQKKGSHR